MTFIITILLQFIDPVVWLVSGLAGWFIPNRLAGSIAASLVPNIIAAVVQNYSTGSSRSITSIIALSIAATILTLFFAWIRKKKDEKKAVVK